MLALVAMGIAIGVFTWRYPLGGLALALNTTLFRTPLQEVVLAYLPGAPVTYTAYSAVFFVPTALALLGRMVHRHLAWPGVQRRRPPLIGMPDVWPVALLFLLAYGITYSPDRSLGFAITAKYASMVLLFYFLGRSWVWLASNPKKDIESFVKWTIAFALIAGLTALLSPRPVPFGDINWRLSIAGVSAIPFALLMGTGVLYALVLLTTHWTSGPLSKLVMALSLGFLAFCLLSSNTRGVLVSTILGACYVIIALSGGPRNWASARPGLRAAIVVAGAAVVLGLLTALWPPLRFKFHEIAAWGGTVGYRSFFITQALELFKESPVIGLGTGAMTVYLGDYVHNIFLELGAENGILALITFGIFMATLFYLCADSLRRGPSLGMLLVSASLVYYLACAQFSFTLHHLKHLFLMAGFAVGLWVRPASGVAGEVRGHAYRSRQEGGLTCTRDAARYKFLPLALLGLAMSAVAIGVASGLWRGCLALAGVLLVVAGLAWELAYRGLFGWRPMATVSLLLVLALALSIPDRQIVLARQPVLKKQYVVHWTRIAGSQGDIYWLQRAAYALGRLGAPEALDTLEPLLASPNPELQAAVREALNRLQRLPGASHGKTAPKYSP